jgi:ketosteroid isomerase-like protein
VTEAEQAVCEVNRRFYEALAALDVEQMDAVWLQEDWVECVHPGRELLTGWLEVRKSWEGIFANTRRMQVEVSSVLVRIEGTVAWIACTERVTSLFESGFDEALVQATNVFLLRDGVWKMVAHHASPLLGPSRAVLQ